MKVLIVSSCPTHPTNAGNCKFIINQVELLKKMGHTVYFLYINEQSIRSKESSGLEEMKNYWGAYYFEMRVNTFSHIRMSLLIRLREKFYSGFHKCDDYYYYGLASQINKLNESLSFDVCLLNYFYLSKAALNIKK